MHSLVGNHEMNLLSLVGLRLDNIYQIRRKCYYSSSWNFFQSKQGLSLASGLYVQRPEANSKRFFQESLFHVHLIIFGLTAVQNQNRTSSCEYQMTMCPMVDLQQLVDKQSLFLLKKSGSFCVKHSLGFIFTAKWKKSRTTWYSLLFKSRAKSKSIYDLSVPSDDTMSYNVVFYLNQKV